MCIQIGLWSVHDNHNLKPKLATICAINLAKRSKFWITNRALGSLFHKNATFLQLWFSTVFSKTLWCGWATYLKAVLYGPVDWDHFIGKKQTQLENAVLRINSDIIYLCTFTNQDLHTQTKQTRMALSAQLTWLGAIPSSMLPWW